MDNENKAYIHEGGVRRHYQVLIHAQQHASLLYQDYIHDYGELADQQKSRFKSMHAVRKRLDSLTQVPSLEVMATVLNENADGMGMGGKSRDGVYDGVAEEKAAKEWLQSELFVLDQDTHTCTHTHSHTHLFEKAIHKHLEAKQAVMDTTKWSSVYLPNFESHTHTHSQDGKLGDPPPSHTSSNLLIQTHYLNAKARHTQPQTHTHTQTHTQFKHLAG
ncbi:hypothetical protein EON63_18820, partial [archaeon]